MAWSEAARRAAAEARRLRAKINLRGGARKKLFQGIRERGGVDELTAFEKYKSGQSISVLKLHNVNFKKGTGIFRGERNAHEVVRRHLRGMPLDKTAWKFTGNYTTRRKK